MDAKGRIVIGDDGSGGLSISIQGGKVLDAFTAGECDVSVDPDGNVYCSAFGVDELRVYNPSHELIGSWTGPDMVVGSAPQFGPNGEILALNRESGGIVKLKVTLPPA